MTVDIGSNLTSLLERLAQQIGTTVDKVFPWYVQQAHLEGIIFIVGLTVVFAVSLSALVFGIVKGEWRHGDPSNLAAVCTILGAICVVVSVIATLVEVPDAVTKVYNPQYHAMKMLTRDIGRMMVQR